MLRAARTNEERQMIMQRARDMLRTAAEAHARAGRNVESVVRQVLGEDVSAEQAEQAASPRQAGQTAQAGQSGAQGRRDRRSWFGGLGIGSQQQQQQQNGEGQGGRPGEGATRRP
jgi:transcription initiation factor TFIID subunit TAF12